ncbi:MAG: hypothetical protein KY456_15630 [Chloroflexi bacterium]|nr:hypothetical protein [Chloroflexota bacterium]
MHYLYAILEAEARIALRKLGLDAGQGVLHADGPFVVFRTDKRACPIRSLGLPLGRLFVPGQRRAAASLEQDHRGDRTPRRSPGGLKGHVPGRPGSCAVSSYSAT